MADRTILITGCSSGIGLDAAHGLHERGWRVFATCRREADCARLRAEGLESFPLDLQDPDSIAAGFDEAMSRAGGRLDALFNNGAYAQPGAVEDLPVEALRAIFEANLFGWHDLTRRSLRIMRAQGHGRIVQNSSVLGFVSLRMRGAYCATKHAVEGLTDALRLELRGTGIHVVLIEPGPVTSRIRQNSRAHYEAWIDRENTPWAEFYRGTVEPRLYDEEGTPDPFELPASAVTKKLVRALESRRPAARYYVTTPTYMMSAFKRLLPTSVLDRLLARI